MQCSKTKFVVTMSVFLAGIAGIGALIQEAPAQDNPADLAPNNTKLLGEKKPIKVASPRDGIILTFNKLKEGDRVKADQIIARLDDRLAQIDVELARIKLAAAKFELEASEKVFKEAETRYIIALKAPRGTYDAEAIREKKLGMEKFQAEVDIKKEAVNLASFDVRRAEILLDMHVIRSPVRGVIRVIHKNRGEGVKALEPVLEIVPDKE